ncbi:MAG: 50S ribosomal protein L11 methyltransferase, partial [Rhodothermales bacterium]|nr:50S ribosomal protein L11 methyltransferase [Rhodothermales bacterium]
DSVTFLTGTIEEMLPEASDVIVANINRAVLIGSLSHFSDRLADEGRLIVSGLLLSDREIMVAAAVQHELAVETELEEGDWWSCTFRRQA